MVQAEVEEVLVEQKVELLEESEVEKGVGRARAERAGVTVVDWSVN